MPFALLKELVAKWLINAFEYACDNPQFVVNGFIRSGITRAFDATISESQLSDDEDEELSSEEQDDEELSSDEEEDEEL